MRTLCTIAVLAVVALPARAQENFEIQVYGSETVLPGITMVELHSNVTSGGSTVAEDGLLPTQHAIHETIEITHGVNPWSEVGFYVFTSMRNGRWEWVGDHIRPRVRAPEEWHWPVGASLSAEVGYQRRAFSQDTWSLELRPIVDKQLGRWYLSFNPTVDRALRTDGGSGRFEFSPNAAVTADVNERVNVGLEYYGELGPFGGFLPVSQQQHQIFAATNLNFGPEWEFNAGVGWAVTRAGDRRLVKFILGRRFGRAARSSR